MGVFDRIRKGFVAALSDTTTSEDLAEQIQGLEPKGVLARRRTGQDIAHVRNQERVIDMQNRQIDELTIDQILEDWCEIRDSLEQNTDFATRKTVDEERLFYTDKKRACVRNLQEINKALQKFLRDHSADIVQIKSRGYVCLAQSYRMDSAPVWYTNTFYDLHGIVDQISRANEEIIAMTSNQGLMVESASDRRAAKKLFSLFDQANLLAYNYSKAAKGVRDYFIKS